MSVDERLSFFSTLVCQATKLDPHKVIRQKAKTSPAPMQRWLTRVDIFTADWIAKKRMRDHLGNDERGKHNRRQDEEM